MYSSCVRGHIFGLCVTQITPQRAIRAGDPEHEGQLVAAAPCAACGGKASLPHMNCANIDCNKLFLACDQHKVLG